MGKLIEMLSDDTGRLSTGRIMAFASLIASFFCIYHGVEKEITLGLIGAAFGGKTLQSMAER